MPSEIALYVLLAETRHQAARQFGVPTVSRTKGKKGMAESTGHWDNFQEGVHPVTVSSRCFMMLVSVPHDVSQCLIVSLLL